MKISRFLKRCLKQNWFQGLVAFLITHYIRFVYATTRWTVEGAEEVYAYRAQNRPLIICFWHGRLLILCAACAKIPPPFYMLMSDHVDAAINLRVAKAFGVQRIPGSSGKKGVQAMRAMIKTLHQGHIVGITPEGLRGPYQVVGDGLVRLAQMSQCDVFPVSFATSRYRILRSWDRFFIPFPFSRGALICGGPIAPHTEPDGEKLKAEITAGLKAATARADQLCGVSPS